MFAFLCSFFLVGQGIGKNPTSMKIPQSCFFVANEGQWEEPFLFKMQAGAVTYYVTPEGLTIDVREYERREARSRLNELDPLERYREPEPVSVRGHVLKMNFVGGNVQAVVRGEERLESYSNYFIGRDSCNWRSRVGHYQRVVMEEVWNGIDVEFRAQPNGVETVYHVKPGADPSQIMIEYEGLNAPLRTDSQGSLILATSLGDLTEKAPWAYQIIGNRQQEVPIEFRVIGDNRCMLNPEVFDREKELVIDPLVMYSSYFGGTGDDAINSLQADSVGNVFLFGDTYSRWVFPITPGAYQDSLNYGNDFFMSKLNSTASDLIFSTYVGGNWFDYPADGVLLLGTLPCMVGRTGRPGHNPLSDWPLTPGAFDTTCEGPEEGIIVVLSADGTSLIYSSFLGGADEDEIREIELVDERRLLSTGTTYSSDFPITSGCLYPTLNAEYSATITEFDFSDIQSWQITYSSFFAEQAPTRGGNLLADHGGTVWLSGGTLPGGIPVTPNALQPVSNSQYASFFTQLNLMENEILYSSYVPGAGDSTSRRGTYGAVAIANPGRVLLIGDTDARSFPVTQGAFDIIGGFDSIAENSGFLMDLLLPDSIIASTFISSAYPTDLKQLVNSDYLFCAHLQSDFPITQDAYDSTRVEEGWVRGEGLVGVISSDLSRLMYASYIGGSDWDGVHIIEPAREASQYWIAGASISQDVPTTVNAFMPLPPDWQLPDFELVDGIFSRWDFSDLSTNEPRPLPREYSISISAYPNPFNSSAILNLNLPKSTSVEIILYDLIGRTTKVIDHSRYTAGEHRIPLDAADLPSGSYFVSVRTTTQSVFQKLVLLR